MTNYDVKTNLNQSIRDKLDNHLNDLNLLFVTKSSLDVRWSIINDYKRSR